MISLFVLDQKTTTLNSLLVPVVSISKTIFLIVWMNILVQVLVSNSSIGSTIFHQQYCTVRSGTSTRTCTDTAAVRSYVIQAFSCININLISHRQYKNNNHHPQHFKTTTTTSSTATHYQYQSQFGITLQRILQQQLLQRKQHYYSTTSYTTLLGGTKSNSMPRGIKNENLPTKVCIVCNRPFTWRKKWERCWDEVTTCSKSCNSQRRKGTTSTTSTETSNNNNSNNYESENDSDSNSNSNSNSNENKKKKNTKTQYSTDIETKLQTENSSLENDNDITTNNEQLDDDDDDNCIEHGNVVTNDSKKYTTVSLVSSTSSLSFSNSNLHPSYLPQSNNYNPMIQQEMIFVTASNNSNNHNNYNNNDINSNLIQATTTNVNDDDDVHPDNDTELDIQTLSLLLNNNNNYNDSDGDENEQYNDNDDGTVITNQNEEKERNIVLCPKQLRKIRKKQIKEQKRIQRQGLGDTSLGQKQCTVCSKSVNVLIRCTIDSTQQWHMVCGKCWNTVSGGIVDGSPNHPYYKYGGLWKNRRIQQQQVPQQQQQQQQPSPV